MNILAVTLPFSFDKPQWLWLCALIPLIVVFSIRSLAGLGGMRRVLAITIRSLVILVAAAILADVQRVQVNENLTVMFLMDRSLSVRDHADAQEAYMEAVSKNVPPQDRVGVIDFARMAFLEQLPMTGGYFLDRGRLPPMPNPERTDVAAAVRLAMAMFPHDTAKRIVLMSDGNDNMGDLINEARRAAADGVVIDVNPLWYNLRNEVYFDKMVAPASAEAGEIVPIRMNLHANQTTTGRIDIYHNGQKINLPKEVASQTLRPGNNSLLLKLPVTTDGVQRFEARFVPDNPAMDTTVDNNRATAFTFVSGKGKVAIMTMNPEHDEVLLDALLGENIKAVMIDVSQDIPDLAGMLDYAAIILANVPAHAFTDEQLTTLASYIEDLGGGLIMTGGNESFGAGGWIGTPIADVLPVDLEIKHKRTIPRGALAIICHSCELPRGNFWGKLVAKKAVDTISSRDYIGILAYAAGGESWEVPLQLATNKTVVKNRIDRMAIGDMPDFDATMRLAVAGMKQTDAAQKHCIIISDGDAQAPAPKLLDEFVDAQITVSTIAIGYGQHVMEQTLRDIAKKTGGRFYACTNPRNLPQIFVKESKVVRRPLLIDEPFTPQVSYAKSDLLAGIDTSGVLPPLGGLVLTTPKPGLAFFPLIRVTDDGDDPVLAHWQRGLGRAVAFTGGYWPVWGGDWPEWSQFSKLWAQTVRWTMRQEAPANFDTFTSIEGNQGRIIIEALDKDADYLNFLNLQSKVIHPTKGAIPVQFMQTGPGHYEAFFDVDQSGQYIANIAIYRDGQYNGSIHTGAAMPFSPELRELSTNEALLRQVAEITGGRWLELDPAADDVFDHNLPPSLSKQPAWDWTLAWLLLPLFLLDVASRRLASWLALSIVVELLVDVVLLFGLGIIYTTWWGALGVLLLGEVIGWTIRFQYIGPLFDWLTHGVTALSHTGERSTASLGRLKSAKGRVREEGQAQKSAEGSLPPSRTRTASSDARDETIKVNRGTKFDVGEPQPGTSKDLGESLGGAQSSDVTKKPKPDAEPPADSEDHTSRLLRAKRRAQKRHDDRPD